MAADGTATKESEEKLIPEDESVDAQGSTEVIEDPEDEDDEIDEELLDLASTFGVDPSDFADAAELEKEIYRLAGQQNQEREPVKSAADPTPEELAVEAYTLKLDGENLDAGLITELQKFSKVQTERFSKVLNDLQKKHAGEIGSLRKQFDQLARVTRTQVEQNDFRLIDKWRRKNESAQEYYGEEDYGDIDHDSRNARRMRSLKSKAYRLASTYQGKRPPSPGKLLDMAFSATPRKGKGKDKPQTRKTPTHSARATGSGVKVGPAKRGEKRELSEEQQMEEAGAKVAEWQRQHGIQ